MEVVLLIIGSLTGLAAGIWIGLKWGMRLADRPSWRYWAANGVMALAGLVIATAGQFLGAHWFAVSGVGIMAGGITGLKYGYGQSPGVWAIHDRFLRIDGPEGPADEDREGRRRSGM